MGCTFCSVRNPCAIIIEQLHQHKQLYAVLCNFYAVFMQLLNKDQYQQFLREHDRSKREEHGDEDDTERDAVAVVRAL